MGFFEHQEEAGEASGPGVQAALHEGWEPPLRRGDLGVALGGDQRRARPAGVRAARHRGAQHLEPDGHQHRRFQVLSGSDRLSRP